MESRAAGKTPGIALASGDGGVYEELREREAGLNIVMFGKRGAARELVQEEVDRTGHKELHESFASLKLDLTADLIKFCRRFGKFGEAARPLVVGSMRKVMNPSS